jgi:hypothetical protein
LSFFVEPFLAFNNKNVQAGRGLKWDNVLHQIPDNIRLKRLVYEIPDEIKIKQF